MVAASDVVRYLLSPGGVILLFLAATILTALFPSSRRVRRGCLAAAIIVTILSAYGVEFFIGRALLVSSLKPFRASDAVSGRRTAIVILGTGRRDAQDWDENTYAVVDEVAASRVLEARRVYAMTDPAVVISSGGKPHPERRTVPTGETMRDALITLGVPASRIIVETISRTTRDEAVVVAPMLKAHNIEQVVLVTSETHMRRSLGAFRAAGVTAIPAIAYEFERRLPLKEMIAPTKIGVTAAAENAHELLGILYYWLRGWYK